ncbi:MAG: recombinase family protein [Bacilli bacterium]|nr:recombinase family protein [Bacilli bacterium]
MDKKIYCIAFQRVSTVGQDIDEQAKQLREYIIRDGWKESQIVTIGAAGASAIKEDEEYKACIEEIYSTLKEKKVKCIYCWELSRIFRKKVVGTELVDYLGKNGINLKIMTPSLYLLDPITGEINTGMELAISLFTTMAEQEMRLKKERFRRTKERYAREGKWSGGKTIPFGYYVDNNGYFQIKEDEALFVIKCYTMYASGKYSLNSLSRELNEEGYNTNYRQIQNILKNRDYTGICQNNSNRIYPKIIDIDTFNKVQNTLKENFTGDLLKQNKHFFYCSRLIKEGNMCYIPSKHCYKYEKKFVSISLMDGLVLAIATFFETNNLISLNKEELKELLKENRELEKKINNIPSLISKLDEKFEKAVIRNIEGKLSDEKLNEIEIAINKEKQDLQQHLLSYKSKMEFNTNKINLPPFKERVKNIALLNYTEKDKQQLVRKYITEIRLEWIENRNIIVSVKTIYGWLKVRINPWSKKNIYSCLDGTPIYSIYPVYRREGREAYTIREMDENDELDKRRLKYLYIPDNIDELFEGERKLYSDTINFKIQS